MRKNLILSTLYQILTMVTPLLTAPYVSRVLGADGVGVYSYTNSIVTYFTMFAALGTVSYGSREIARVREDPASYSKLFWEIELLTLLTTGVCLLVWMGWCFTATTYRIYYLILTMSLLAQIFDISWFYAGLEQFQYTVLQNALFKILGVVAIFLFVREKQDLGVYVGIVSATVLLGNASMWLYLPRFLVKVSGQRLCITRHFRETLVYFVPTIATSIYTVLDKTLLGAITNDAYENGYYDQATKIINIAKSVTFTGLNSVLGSRISWLFAKKEYDQIRIRIAQSMDFILFMGIGMCFGIWAVAEGFVPLFFGQGFEKVSLLLKLMCPLILIVGVSNCLGSQYYNPAGLRGLSAKFLIAGSAVNLVFNLLLIPVWTSVGAVVATLLAEGIISMLYLRYCDGVIRLKTLWKMAQKKLLAGLIMFIIVCRIGSWMSGNWSVILQIGAGVVVYILCLTALKDSVIFELVLPALKKQQKSKGSD